MATITPTLTITANAASAATTPGPSSSAISLSVTDVLTVDVMKASTVTGTMTTHALLFDGSAEDDGGVAGQHGCFLYLKNTSPSDHDIHIGASIEGGAAISNLSDADDTVRLMTLKQNEFAFFPYDYTMDLVVDAEDNTATLEYLLFNRAI